MHNNAGRVEKYARRVATNDRRNHSGVVFYPERRLRQDIHHRLDLWGAMTAGASRPPRVGDLVGRLREAGYEDVAATPIGPGGMYVAFTGTWTR